MAWLAWLVVHIYFLIGFRNRIGVFWQWAWTYLSLQDGARLITGSQDLPGWDDESKAGADTSAKAAAAPQSGSA